MFGRQRFRVKLPLPLLNIIFMERIALDASSGAQVFTPEEAKFVGLEGIPDNPDGHARKLIACGAAEKNFIASRLEANAAVASFRLLELG